ncbi:MAG TPA: TetR/AcrR family transcriptional regulator [Thermoleophilaceae bacterium]|nr:TetR/AcrR family transcriptional regulator [Thermoleophilaceae bacterium]
MALDSSRAARAPHQLPPGRHGLARSFVARNQRERILAAVAQVASTRGYGAMSVQDVVREAGVSRRTFYEQFKNKDDAFLAAYDEASGRLMTAIRAALDAEAAFEGKVSAGFRAFLELLAASPAFAKMCIVEVLAAGPEAIARRARTMEEFTRFFEDAAQETLVRENPPSPLIAETIVGGVYETVYRRIARGETDQLPRLLPDLVESALLPYVGEHKATAQRRLLLEGRPPTAR